MSDIGRLYRRIGTVLHTPIENFTTEALAIAIEHDDVLMRRALETIAWPLTGRSPFDVDQVVRIDAHTQEHLPESYSPGIREGYLDLVLELTLESGEKVPAWVEVKVDSPENGDQLDVYADHARHRTPRPVIFTLSKSEVHTPGRHPDGFEIGWLSWRDLAEVIEACNAGERWIDLLEFLREEQLAWPRMPLAAPAPEPYLPVLIEVNNWIREQWPSHGIAWHGTNSSALTKAAVTEYRSNNHIIGTAGPLTYGLVPSGKDWAWSITVGSVNYQNVKLDPGEIVRLANRMELPRRWKRLSTKHAALEARLPLAECVVHEEAVSWFQDAIRELNEKEILRGFFEGLDAKFAK